MRVRRVTLLAATTIAIIAVAAVGADLVTHRTPRTDAERSAASTVAGPGATPPASSTSSSSSPAPTKAPPPSGGAAAPGNGQVIPTTSHPTTPAAGRLPLSYSVGNARQVVTVVAAAGATEGTLRRWVAVSGGWRQVGPAVRAYVGDAGISSNAREGFDATPAGSFTLTQAFGRNAEPQTRLPYFRTDANDWWAGDSASPSTYNTHQRCAAAACSFRTSESEQLYYVPGLYDYAVVIDYNMHPSVPGKGSAFFLHVQGGEPTEGCVSIDRSVLLDVLAWLNPADHPRIMIGTG